MNIRILIILLFTALNVLGEPEEVQYREVSDSLIEVLQADGDFNYSIRPEREILDPSEVFLSRLRSLFLEFWRGLFSNTGRAVLYILAALIILYALFRLLGPDRVGSFSNKAIRVQNEYQHWDQSAESLENLLLKAQKNQDWRECIRLQFLIGLKYLQGNGHLEVSPKKTSLDYSYEIADRNLAKRFLEFSRTFEYVWYGGFDADAQRAKSYQEEAAKLREL